MMLNNNYDQPQSARLC